jgi:hypothetical protein
MEIFIVCEGYGALVATVHVVHVAGIATFADGLDWTRATSSLPRSSSTRAAAD